jgi:hypothetical protein
MQQVVILWNWYPLQEEEAEAPILVAVAVEAEQYTALLSVYLHRGTL